MTDGETSAEIVRELLRAFDVNLLRILLEFAEELLPSFDGNLSGLPDDEMLIEFAGKLLSAFDGDLGGLPDGEIVVKLVGELFRAFEGEFRITFLSVVSFLISSSENKLSLS